jgi:hypothetical protein
MDRIECTRVVADVAVVVVGGCIDRGGGEKVAVRVALVMVMVMVTDGD